MFRFKWSASAFLYKGTHKAGPKRYQVINHQAGTLGWTPWDRPHVQLSERLVAPSFVLSKIEVLKCAAVVSRDVVLTGWQKYQRSSFRRVVPEKWRSLPPILNCCWGDYSFTFRQKAIGSHQSRRRVISNDPRISKSPPGTKPNAGSLVRDAMADNYSSLFHYEASSYNQLSSLLKLRAEYWANIDLQYIK